MLDILEDFRFQFDLFFGWIPTEILAGLFVLFAVIFYFQFYHGTTKKLRVLDGDTVEDQYFNKYRLAGIDAPETGQKYGDKATEYLKRRVEGKRVWLVLKMKTYTRGRKKGMSLPEKDHHGRNIIYLKTQFFKIDINKKMVKSRNAIPAYGDEYQDYERKVKFTNPSIFRKSKKNK